MIEVAGERAKRKEVVQGLIAGKCNLACHYDVYRSAVRKLTNVKLSAVGDKAEPGMLVRGSFTPDVDA